MKLIYYVNGTESIFAATGYSTTTIFETTVDGVEYRVTAGSTSSGKMQDFAAVLVQYPHSALELEIRVLKDPTLGKTSRFDKGGTSVQDLYERLTCARIKRVQEKYGNVTFVKPTQEETDRALSTTYELRDRCLAAHGDRFNAILAAVYAGGVSAGISKQQEAFRDVLGL